jgi:DNA-binding transcriptional LysR family regulator
MDRASELALVVAVVDHGSFSAAAEALRLTPSGISKAVTRLERRLGTRLLERTTRRLSTTTEGDRYVAAGRRILAEIDEMEAGIVEVRGRPQGLIRLSIGVAFAVHQLAPVLPVFRERYPDIALDLSVTDRMVDVLAEGVDVAIRTGPVIDDRLVNRPFASIRRVICASPAYLARFGRPTRVSDLKRHTCVNISASRHLSVWTFVEDGRAVQADTHDGHVLVDNAMGVLALGLAGVGIVRLGDFLLSDALRSGALVELFQDSHVKTEVPVQLVFAPGRQRLPRIRVFLDFITEHFRAPPWKT